MRPDDRERLEEVPHLGLEARDDGGLGEVVREVLEGDVGVVGRLGDDAGDVVVQPLRALLAGRSAKVAVVVTREMRKGAVHALGGDEGEEALDEGLVG